MIKRISTKNTKIQWDPRATPNNSPANMFPGICNSQDSDQELPSQYSNGEAFPAFDAPFEPVIESQQAIFGPHELPQLSVHPLASPELIHNSKVAGYDSPTSHLFASPIWPPDENVSTDRSGISNSANGLSVTSDWGLMDGLEWFCEPFSQIKEICGTSKKMQISHYERTPSHRRRKQKPSIDPPGKIGRNGHKCSLGGCGRVYRRIEHLQRHIKIDHTQYPRTFSCEFCGKSDFRRGDNLRIHRKLHARQASGNVRVKFVPEAAVIIEQERQRERVK